MSLFCFSFVMQAILFQFSYFLFSRNYKCHHLGPPLRLSLIIVYYVKSLVDSTCLIVWYIKDWWHQKFYHLSLKSLHCGTIDSVHCWPSQLGWLTGSSQWLVSNVTLSIPTRTHFLWKTCFENILDLIRWSVKEKQHVIQVAIPCCSPQKENSFCTLISTVGGFIYLEL